MSLHAIADHMASKGRGPDTMLIHMAPSEVRGLQALAMAHGGSLTINPETGLPEAGWLSKLLPAIIGFALNTFAPGVGTAIGSALGAGAATAGAIGTGVLVGGVEALRTGDIGRGISAGLGAYGGAGLGASLAGNVATGAVESQIGNEALKTAGLTGEAALTAEADQVASRAIESQLPDKLANMTPYEKLAAGAKAATSSPEAFGSFAMNNAKPLMYAAAPILADQAVMANMPTTTTRPGQVHTFSYNPYNQFYTPTGNYEVPTKAAGGGLMGMNDGGYSPFNYAGGGDPVVRMADGGQTVDDLYASIGRTPDAEGKAFWQNAFGTGPVTADQAASFMQSANAVKAQEAAAPNLVASNNASALGLSPSQATYYNQLMAGPNANAADNLSYVKGLSDYQSLASAGVTGGNLTPEQRALITGDNGYAAADMLANKYGISGPVSMGQGQTITPTGGGLAALQPQAAPAAPTQTIATTTSVGADPATAKALVSNMYRNVLGRDADPEGLAFWSNAIASGRSPESIYQDFLASARSNTELVRADQIANKTFTEATTPYTGYMSTDTGNIVDEWVRNTLGREPTAADRQQPWYQDAFNKMHTQSQAQDLYKQFQTYAGKESGAEIAKRIALIDAELKSKGLTDADLFKQTGKTKKELASEGFNLDLNWMGASQLAPAAKRKDLDLAALKPLSNTFGGDAIDRTITNPYGNTTNPGDLTFNRDGTVTVTPNIPYRPYGGFSGMGEVKDAYTQGGGSLGYVPAAPKTIEEFNTKYNKLTGGSKQAYDYLTGKSAYSATPYTATGEVMKPYAESVMGVPANISSKRMLFDPATKTYKLNPDYIPVSYTSEGQKVYGLSSRDIASELSGGATSDYEQWAKTNNVTLAQIAEALGISLAEAKKRYPKVGATTAATTAATTTEGANGGLMAMARGGMARQPFFSKTTGKFNMASPKAYADGGMADHYNLGGYSDGGRLLRGPGDGVSDSIPATIGNKQPARLADGEFVVPARIVSELGNGSTEAGARKLYAMMDRVQAARKNSIGKGKVAKNSRADKYLPA